MVSKKSKKKKFLLFLIGKNRNGSGKKGGCFQLGMGQKFGPLEKGRKSLPSDQVHNLLCMQLASYLEEGPMMYSKTCLKWPL